MYTHKLVDFAARFQYLAALDEQRPIVLTDLQEHTFPLYQRCWQEDRNTTALQDLAQLSTAVRRGAGEFKAVAEALEEWADTHGFRDMWLKDAGIQSMHGWVHGDNAGKWRYFPEELETPKFQPNFGGYWIPFFTPWPDFKTATDKIYRSALIAYRAEVRTLWGEGKTELQQHAVWTVRWQLDKSPEAIRNWHFHTTGRTVSVANVQLAVHAFAESAGITLRKPRAGRRAKKM